VSIAAFPLQWPVAWRRTGISYRTAAGFGRARQRIGDRYVAPRSLTIAEGTERVLTELSRMGLSRDDVVISTNLRLRLDGLPASGQSEPVDVGVAIYWRERGGATRVIAIDRYDRVADNLAAVAATLDAMRAIERHGGAVVLERAFTGFTALPPPAVRRWRIDLGLSDSATLVDARAAWMRLRGAHHPDRGGEAALFDQINKAWEAAQKELA
jgi:hypothetical protein